MQPVVRALKVLSFLAVRPKGALLGEIAEGLDLPVASCHRLLAVLEGESFIVRSATSRRYFLGEAARALGETGEHGATVFTSGTPAIERASRETGETVFVCESVGDAVVCTALAESSYPLRLFVRVGQRMPLHAAASARVMLAWQPLERVETLLSSMSLTPFTPETPATAAAVIAHLDTVRRRGYDICESELDENVWAVSLPVRAADGKVVASATLSAPKQRLARASDRDHALAVMRECAETMSRDLGWSQP